MHPILYYYNTVRYKLYVTTDKHHWNTIPKVTELGALIIYPFVLPGNQYRYQLVPHCWSPIACRHYSQQWYCVQVISLQCVVTSNSSRCKQMERVSHTHWHSIWRGFQKRFILNVTSKRERLDAWDVYRNLGETSSIL